MRFYQIISDQMKADKGKYKWGVTTSYAYLPLDNSGFFENDLSLVDWLRQYAKTDEEREEVFFKRLFGEDAL